MRSDEVGDSPADHRQGRIGSFTLGNAAGATVVQAGANGNGVGLVQAGPRMGALIGGLAIPDAIMGK